MGDMESQQKTNRFVDEHGDWIDVSACITTGAGKARLHAGSPTVYVSKVDAPRLAMELLLAAGWQTRCAFEVEGDVSQALEYLETAVKILEEERREAAEYEELKAEALTLYNVFNGRPEGSPWPMRVTPDTARWVETAKAARELHHSETEDDCG